MKTKLKDNIFIEGFDDFNDYVKYGGFKYLAGKTVLYHGKTSEFSENIAKKCVSELWFLTEKVGYTNNIDELEYKTAKEVIQSACNQPYCIIYKQKTSHENKNSKTSTCRE